MGDLDAAALKLDREWLGEGDSAEAVDALERLGVVAKLQPLGTRA